jgi:hypothetical protein
MVGLEVGQLSKMHKEKGEVALRDIFSGNP